MSNSKSAQLIRERANYLRKHGPASIANEWDEVARWLDSQPEEPDAQTLADKLRDLVTEWKTWDEESGIHFAVGAIDQMLGAETDDQQSRRELNTWLLAAPFRARGELTWIMHLGRFKLQLFEKCKIVATGEGTTAAEAMRAAVDAAQKAGANG